MRIKKASLIATGVAVLAGAAACGSSGPSSQDVAQRPRVTDETTAAAVPDGLTLTANWYMTRAHYAPTDAMAPYSPHRAGHRGIALCGSDVYDQALHNTFDRARPRVLTEMPLCMVCARKAARREFRVTAETTTEWGVRWTNRDDVTTTVRRYSEEDAARFVEGLCDPVRAVVVHRTVTRTEWVEVTDA